MPRSRREPAAPSPAADRSKYAPLGNGYANGRPTFASTDHGNLAAALDSVLSDGDAIMFGRTSDSGAVAVCILSGAERIKRYAGHQHELDELLTYLASL